MIFYISSKTKHLHKGSLMHDGRQAHNKTTTFGKINCQTQCKLSCHRCTFENLLQQIVETKFTIVLEKQFELW